MTKQNRPLFCESSNETLRQLQEMVADFLAWETSCHMNAQEFITWSRGIKTATINENNKTIAFLNPVGYDYSCICDKQLLYAEHMMQAVYHSYPHGEMEDEFVEWIKDTDFSNPPIANHIDWGPLSAWCSFVVSKNIANNCKMITSVSNFVARI